MTLIHQIEIFCRRLVASLFLERCSREHRVENQTARREMYKSARHRLPEIINSRDALRLDAYGLHPQQRAGHQNRRAATR